MRKIIAAIVLFGVLVVACVPNTLPKTKPVGWVLLQVPNHPPDLAGSGFAYDANLSEGVVFGGLAEGTWSDETWVWDGNNWSMANPLTRPPTRKWTAMAYDETRHRIVLFGGQTKTAQLDDTWEWDGENWQLMSPRHKPPARCCHAMAYDSVQRKVLMYGGLNQAGGVFFNDTWEWDGNDWTNVSCCGVPLASGHTLVNYSDEARVIAVPMCNCANTWYWNGENWVELAVRLDPARHDTAGVYDSKNKRIILYGGTGNGSPSDETWIFYGNTWFLLNLAVQPPGRYGHVMFYDNKRQSVILFGGAANVGDLKKRQPATVLVETWELKLPEDLSTLTSAIRTLGSKDQQSSPPAPTQPRGTPVPLQQGAEGLGPQAASFNSFIVMLGERPR